MRGKAIWFGRIGSYTPLSRVEQEKARARRREKARELAAQLEAKSQRLDLIRRRARKEKA